MEGLTWWNCLIVCALFSRVNTKHLTNCCRTINASVDCSHCGLQKVPRNLTVNTTSLDLSSNFISILNNEDFYQLKNLQHLILNFNPLTAIEVDAFHGLSNLLHLEIYGHVLNYTYQSLPDLVFAPLKSLQTLILRSDMSRFTRFQPELPDKAIGKLETLTELNIDTTPKTVFHEGFSNLNHLKKLKLCRVFIGSQTYKCALSDITNDTFQAFHSSNIQFLDLTSCELQRYDSGCLKPLSHLNTFRFNDIRYSGAGGLDDILIAFHPYENKSMDLISIDAFYPVSAETGTGHILSFKTLSKICVRRIVLSKCRIILVDIDVLLIPPVPLLSTCIEELVLRENSITGKANRLDFNFLEHLSSIKRVDLSLQQIFQYNYGQNLNQKAPHIKRYPFGVPLLLPPSLEYFDIAGMPYMIGEMSTTYFFNGENLRHLNLSYCGLYDFYHRVFGLKNLEVLDLSGNDLSIIEEGFFDLLPNLTYLRLENALLDNIGLLHGAKWLLSPLKRLQILDISNNNIFFLSRDIFYGLPNLQQIVLVGNKLTAIPDVTSLGQLHHIHLSYNSLTTIDEVTRTMLDEATVNNPKFRISINGNNFYCGCSSYPFLIWLNETLVNLDGRNYTCMNKEGKVTKTGLLYKDLTSLYRTCSSPFWLNMAITGISLTFVILVAGFVFVKNKLKIQLIILRMIGQNVHPKKRSDFVYDVSALLDIRSTYNFIRATLCPELKKKNMSVYLGTYGRQETLNIVQAIRDSWKIVLIITKEFLETDLCLFTICNCLSAITLTTPNRIILLIDNEAVQHIPSNIHFLFEAVSQSNIFYMDLEQALDDEQWKRFLDSLAF